MNNEFEEMRQQMNILKEKLQQQDIVNEKVMRRTMKRNVSGINRRYTFVSILCILMIPYSQCITAGTSTAVLWGKTC